MQALSNGNERLQSAACVSQAPPDGNHSLRQAAQIYDEIPKPIYVFFFFIVNDDDVI